MRIMRSSVLATKEADYIVAARALGAGTGRIIFKHLIPNCLAPLLVYGTILVGVVHRRRGHAVVPGRRPAAPGGVLGHHDQRGAELHPGRRPYLLFFPAAFLVTAVLSFVMLGEAVREALDPKLR